MDSYEREAKRLKRRSSEEKDRGESEMMSNIIPDDLVLEIMLRLPDSRSAIRCGSVRKAWHSLVSSPEFIPSFLRRHEHRQPPSYTMLIEFRFRQGITCRHQDCQNHMTVEGPKAQAQAAPTNRALSGLLSRPILESACHDLLLLSGKTHRLYLCSLATRQRVKLPRTPFNGEPGGCHALVTRPGPTANYRVLNIDYVSFNGSPIGYYSTIFSSETGRWSTPAPAPRLRRLSIVAVDADGALFWPDDIEYRRLVMFNAFGGSWRYVSLPVDLATEWEFYRGSAVELAAPGEVFKDGSDKNRLHIGTVRGRVRIAQVFRVKDAGTFILKVWELVSPSNSCWRVVHEIKVRPRVDTDWVYIFTFHPDDGDAMFLCFNSDVYHYRAKEDHYYKVFQLSRGLSNDKSLPRFALVVTLTNPIWPTRIPALPAGSEMRKGSYTLKSIF